MYIKGILQTVLSFTKTTATFLPLTSADFSVAATPFFDSLIGVGVLNSIPDHLPSLLGFIVRVCFVNNVLFYVRIGHPSIIVIVISIVVALPAVDGKVAAGTPWVQECAGSEMISEAFSMDEIFAFRAL